MTEDELVAAIRAIVETTVRGRRVRVGIGDDAAVWKPGRSAESVITTDALVEDVHFTRAAMRAQDVGHRALAANLSDVAAMGARPILATIALGVPKPPDVEWILDCYRGMSELARRTGTALAGGDIVRAPALLLSITIVGEVRSSHRTLRGGARPGDVLAVTGALGASRAGLEIVLARPDLAAESRFAEAVRAYRTPEPRLREGLRFGASSAVHAMIDLSDGLSTDLHRLCAASGVGATLDAGALPIADAARSLAELSGADPLSYALDGGEDYELLVAVAARAFGHLATGFRKRFGRPLQRVGVVTEGSSVILRNGERARRLASAGWDHLRE